VKTLTIISVAKEGEDPPKFDSQSVSWDVVEHKILDTRGGIYTEHGVKNYAMQGVKTDYILWADAPVSNIDVASYDSQWTLEHHLDSHPSQATMFFVPTKPQKKVAWRNIPASDYDLRLRLLDMGCSPLILEGRGGSKDWLDNALSIRNAYRHRQTLPLEW
jgi:hypothetical protein